MTVGIPQSLSIVRTEQGLAIAGTRITLYDVMDHLVAGWTPWLILNWLPFSLQRHVDGERRYLDVKDMKQ